MLPNEQFVWPMERVRRITVPGTDTRAQTIYFYYGIMQCTTLQCSMLARALSFDEFTLLVARIGNSSAMCRSTLTEVSQSVCSIQLRMQSALLSTKKAPAF